MEHDKAIEELEKFFSLVNNKLSTKKKLKAGLQILEELHLNGGRVNSWIMGNEIIPKIAEEQSISAPTVYRALNDLIELGIIARTAKGGYTLSPTFRKRVYRLYKQLGYLV
ncbi:hypothetical protein APY94_03780 [Thermococcus celericrescens]|uniref:Plasmid replication protein RepL domain-containing protein n=1 Tax=Thermococcus celericrescens TaxID=227598 RepID=A0A100XYJ0_9EURY|nr:replication/maintenance protein RepL [Thermococcus celericrescens]KUH34003.1 hypothetical protein APY94_03780 [Thermococcus celericrescens]